MSSGLGRVLLQEVNVNGKCVLIREDLNVPLHDGVVVDDTRIQKACETIQHCLDKGARVTVMSHLGRPKEGVVDAQYSLQPVATRLAALLKREVTLLSLEDAIAGAQTSGQVRLLENVRFNVGEKANDDTLAKQYAALCYVFVMDAFATAHRAQASTVGVARYAKESCAGLLLEKELQAIEAALHKPKPPVVAIVGGSKVSTKIGVLESLLDRVDVLITGGGIANTLLAAAGHAVGNSLVESAWIETGAVFIERAKQKNVQLPLPVDVVTALSLSGGAVAKSCRVEAVGADDMILDVGVETAAHYAALIQQAGTVIWNGPVGVFEYPQFGAGTKAIATAVANTSAYTLAGGGDTISALNQYGVFDAIDTVSTGGGAFLEMLEGKQLPAVATVSSKP